MHELSRSQVVHIMYVNADKEKDRNLFVMRLFFNIMSSFAKLVGSNTSNQSRYICATPWSMYHDNVRVNACINEIHDKQE